jgi:hypothetical protein
MAMGCGRATRRPSRPTLVATGGARARFYAIVIDGASRSDMRTGVPVADRWVQ